MKYAKDEVEPPIGVEVAVACIVMCAIALFLSFI